MLEIIVQEKQSHDTLIFIFAIGSLITLYTCLGGVRSVAKTDVLKFLVIVLGIIGFFYCSNLGQRIFANLAYSKNSRT